MDRKLKTLIVLFKAYASLHKNVKSSLVQTQLSVNEFTVMEALYTKKELSTQELIDSILIPNSSLTYVLDELSKRGYLNRKKDENDRRRQYLSLTKEGENVFLEAYDVHYHHMQQIFDVLTQEEQQQLQEYLKRIGLSAQEKLDETY